MRIEFHAVGVPIPQGSQTYGVAKTGRAFGRYQNAARLNAWRKQLAEAAWLATNGAQLTGPLEVRAMFYFERPRSHYRSNGETRADAIAFVTKRPDVDKLIRSVGDALTESIIEDDAQIVHWIAGKYWADDHPQGAHITVTTIGA